MSEQKDYFIWSHRHDQWWSPDRSGYTSHINKAGRYTREEAADITIGSCLPGANIAVSTRLTPQVDHLTAEQVNDELSQWRRL